MFDHVGGLLFRVADQAEQIGGSTLIFVGEDFIDGALHAAAAAAEHVREGFVFPVHVGGEQLGGRRRGKLRLAKSVFDGGVGCRGKVGGQKVEMRFEGNAHGFLLMMVEGFAEHILPDASLGHGAREGRER